MPVLVGGAGTSVLNRLISCKLQYKSNFNLPDNRSNGQISPEMCADRIFIHLYIRLMFSYTCLTAKYSKTIWDIAMHIFKCYPGMHSFAMTYFSHSTVFFQDWFVLIKTWNMHSHTLAHLVA